MTDTDHLIDQLAARARPVQRLASPMRRTALWTLAASVVIALIALAYGPRPDFLHTLADGPALLEWTASIVTGLLAAYATFQISVPGRSPSWAWMPLPALLAWLFAVAWGCATDFARLGRDAFAMQYGSWECAMAITVTGVPLGLVMLLLVRHAGVVRPAATAMLATLSATALSAAGVSLYHHGESALMVLTWHVGAVALLSLLSLAFGRSLLGWIGHARG
ncbi:NrsF family protein [Cognatilysobacter tabacisoli]|uniref:NrsF family protein n=1 Tax=Cognatilysobacter tabacisoli TaxID=2315424 RepID=UPI000E6B1D6F|nr:DUF1109 domain-containing protein [Lysobacter tabacisoli]